MFAIRILPRPRLILLATLAGGLSFGGEFSEKAMITFTAPVEIPGQALPAGTYVFKLIDSSTQNNVIQVFNKDETHLYATFLAIPDHRVIPAHRTFLTFEERPSDTPEAIRALYYRGDHYAREFVYPHDAALAIARRSHQKVLQMRGDVTDPQNLKKAEVTGVDESGNTIPIGDVVTPVKH
jgi:hypothetical protein